jgi:hypothetical protein
MPNGDLFVIAKLNHVARYDWNSRLLWKRSMLAHHDLDVGLDGRVYVLTSSIRKVAFEGSHIPILDNAITRLSRRGKFQFQFQLSRVVSSFIPTWRLSRIKEGTAKGYTRFDLFQEDRYTDVFHANSVEVVWRAIPYVAPVGSFLVSMRETNRVAILDSEAKEVLWSWGEGELEGQHHATVLENGNIMIFDNGVLRKQSRVIEVHPATSEIEWSYTAPGFFTRLRGAAQKLPNGNVLITESDNGHVFEVTHSGEIVWEFWNPDVRGGTNPTRAVIYRMARYEKDFLDKGLL